MIATIGKYLAAKLLTEAFIKRVCLVTARYLADKTSNNLDNEILNALEKALEK